MYCTYLTIYFGDKLPRRYIGSSSVKRILEGYNGSVSSIKWKSIYENEQRENKHLFKTRILKTFETSVEAREFEKQLQIKYDVVTSSLYFNESIATPSGFFGRDVSGKNNPMFGSKRKGEKHKGGENISKSLKHLYSHTEKGKQLKKQTSDRLKTNNPASNPDVMEKIKIKWKTQGRNIANKNGMFGKTSPMKNKKLYNNGKVVKAFSPDEVEEGWVLGRIKTTSLL